ncbi:E3 ubiquitin-protein ligase SNT2 [Candida viswanathii]|uniref:E3 ubiquitin-protein ligase SNT2 n=1 Tax=Candida viswanathii TaxID=5486 RepID=A0A367XTP6_9ASCO|nr:E3 ubiquitin-protein ligase SNT2 [Candida viswanathii]
MSETTTRPRRKATINKTYNDSIDLNSLEYDSLNSMSASNSVNLTSSVSRRRGGGGAGAAAAGGASNSNSVKRSTPKNDDSPSSNGTSTPNKVPNNWQPPPKPEDYFSFRLDLTDAYIDITTQTLYCPNQFPSTNSNGRRKTKPTVFNLTKGQYIYMISEPPGEPYYIGRIMGFKHKNSNQKSTSIDATGEIVDAKDYTFQIQWFYRPRDISKITSDSRLLFASMHTDTCPISSFRGLVEVRHKQDIEDQFSQEQLKETKRGTKKSVSPTASSALETYIQKPNHFYFDKLFDRYMIKFYDVLLTANLLQYAEIENSKSRNFLIALNKRFEFIFVESQRTKSLLNSFSSNSCSCEICGQWCDNPDSISCGECEKYYHMYCLDPPLLKKPSRGFSWSCATCTKKHELEYHQKKLVMLSDNKSSNQDQLASELSVLSSLEAELSREPTPASREQSVVNNSTLPKYENLAIEFLHKDKGNTFMQRRVKEEWCMRYLGQYARLEDGVDVDDRSPYPRASTRIGTKHQAVYIPECDGHPIVYYDVDKPQKKKPSGGNQNNKRPRSKNTPEEVVEEPVKLEVPKEYADINPKEYPSWLQPRPKGYIERGVDDGEGETCTLLWKNRQEDVDDDFAKLDAYVARCAPIAESLDLSPNSPNFMDSILLSYMKHDGDADLAFKEAQKLDKKKLKEPVFSKEEIRRFENGVREFGSELYPVYKKVKTQPSAMVVRFYYLWKKTPNGREIWGNYEGRIQKKVQNIVKDEQKAVKQQLDDLANPEDDSSYESSKMPTQKSFVCKHCQTNSSLRWFRITGHDAKKLNPENKVVALCFRCARLWRRYAVVWEDPTQISKKVSNGKGNGWKKKVEPELASDATAILEHAQSMLTLPTPPAALVPPTTSAPTTTELTSLPNLSPALEVKHETKKRSLPLSSTPAKKRSRVKEEKSETPKPVASTAVAAPAEPELHDKVSDDKIKELLFNKNYKAPEVKKLVKKLPLAKAKEYITDLIENFRVRQLADVYSHLSTIQVPASSIELPFEPSERNCCVCREHDNNSTSSLIEMLICSSCGVNVHASCAGISVAGIENMKSPVKEWLCEPCTNDMRPVHSAIYSCCCCLANEANYELSILGSPFVRPDFLKPIDNGRWCHLLCAVFNSEHVDFHKPKGTKFNENITNTLSINSVDKIFLNNHRHTCEICETKNGAIIKCELCDDKDHYYHITCAQDTPNFKLGFKLVESKDNLVKAEGHTGKLKAILVCPKHDQSKETILSLRTLGKRVTTRSNSSDNEEKPLMQLFLEDLLKNKTSKISGQLKLMNYIENFKQYYQLKDDIIDSTKRVVHVCDKCQTKTSPIWWPQSESNESVLCQSCYHGGKDDKVEGINDEEEEEESSIGKPLNGENYGIDDELDRLELIYTPNIIEFKEEEIPAKPVEPIVESISRSKISLGDILS